MKIQGTRRDSKGSALVYGLVILTVVSIILTSIIGFVATQTKYSLQVHAREEALQVAEAGINFYRWYLAHEVDGKTTQQVMTFWTTGNPYGVATPYEAEYKDQSGIAIGKYRLEVTAPSRGTTMVIARSTGWLYKYPDVPRILEVRFRRPAWSEYVVLSNNDIRFGSGTDVQGKIFSNGGVHFDGVTNNIAYSAVGTYYDSDTDVKATKPGVWTSWVDEYNTAMGSDVFLAGKRYPPDYSIATIPFNSAYGDLNLMKTDATADGTYYDSSGKGRHIILKTNGTFDIRTVHSANSSTNNINEYDGAWENHQIPDGGIIFVENDVWLEGQIDGQRVTIAAANLTSSTLKNVYINGNIRYTNYDGTDGIGIVAQNDIEIPKGSPTDLRIDGAVLSQEGRVGRQHYTNSNCGSWDCQDHKNSITIFGAMATNQRYGFAWTDGTGYASRNLYYDNNLFYFPPPYFPTGTQYVMDLWEEK
jgi:hypothetical protein